MPFQDYGYKPSGITRPRARPTPKPSSSSYYSGDEFGSGNIFTETSPGASTVNFGNTYSNNNDNDNNSYQAPSLVQPPAPAVTAPAAPTPAQIEAERQDRIARVFEAAGATLPQDTGRGGRAGRGIDLYSRDIFKTPFVATPDNTQEIEDYLQRTAVDDALREALGIPDVYQGIPTAEEPEPNIDMSVLQAALMPEPITVEELPEDRMFEGMDGSYMFEDIDEEQPKGLMSRRFDTKGETPARELPEVLSIPEAASYMGRKRAGLIMEGINKLFGMFPPKTDVEKQAKSELEYFLDAQPESSLPDFFKYVPDKVQLAEYMKGRAERKKAAGLMTRPRARPEGLDAPNKKEQAKAVQKYLGITVDGIWGKGSTRKLASWQYQNGIPASGEIDEATIEAMKDPTTEDPRKTKVLKSVLNSAGNAPVLSKVKSWAKENIKDPTKAAAFVATVEAETGGRSLVEGGHTLRSAVRTFVTNNKYMHVGNDTSKPLTAKGLRRKQKLEALGSNATGDEIFDFIYGPDADAIGSNLGNTQATDGSKYKGRGLLQITGRENYRKIGDIIGVDLIANPEKVNDPEYAAAAAMAYLSLPGKDFFSGDLTSSKLASAIGHTGSASARWNRTTQLKNEMYP